ncbi:MAG: cation:proton antiporter [Treponema sp.]|nr:cation:proton antiporter [Treponema sp.]
MLLSLSLIFLLGLAMASICQCLKMPRIIGMLIVGLLLGPYVFNLLDASILGISADLRKMALIIILIKAGLSLDISALRKIGRPAILMSFLPAVFEIIAFVSFAPRVLGVTRLEAAIIGAVLGAVSPAVVVPKMVFLIENRYGTNKNIPQLILAGASLDDVFVIVLFSTFVSMAQGNSAAVMDFFAIPISIILGIVLGSVAGWLLALFFETAYTHAHCVRNSLKVIIVLGTAFLLMAIESWTEGIVSISGLLAIMSMACVLQTKSTGFVSKRLSEKFGKVWLAAEIILFVLVGAAVDIRYTLEAGWYAIMLIFLALIFRSIGVWLSLIGTPLHHKEKFFCMIAYLPKATVQAAIGSVPLSLGLPCGNMVLSIAVLSIILTAPLGAFGMDMTYKTFLTKDAS